MALFSDMLPYLLQQQALPGGPNLGAPIAKSPNNVTAINMPSAKLPGTMDFLNAANSFSNVMGENMLRQQQAHLADINAQYRNYQLSIMPEAIRARLKSLDTLSQPPGGQGVTPTGGGDVGSPVAGTGGGSGVSGGASTVSLPTGGDGIVAPDKLYSFATSIGATPNEAAMLTAAPGVESGYNPSATHDAAVLASKGLPPGYGLYGHNGERLAAMQQMAGSQTPSWQDQVKFALQEMRNQGLSDQANAAKTPEELANVQMGFERPNTNIRNGDYDKRVAYTRQVMQQFGGQGSQTAAVPQPPGPGEPDNVNTPTPPVGGQQPEGANMVYDPVSKTMIDATTGRGLGDIAPSAPGSEEEPKEGDQSALTLAGAAIAAGMNKQANLSPRDQLNQAILSQLGGGQVAGDNAAPSGQFGAGNAIPQAMWGQFPALPSSQLGVRGANLSAPFSQAAQAAGSPSPTVPYGGNAPKPPASAAPAMPTAMPQGAPSRFQLDPVQAQLLKAQILGEAAGLPGGNELLQAYQNSPYAAAQRAMATTGATHTAAFPFIGPEATAKAQADAAVKLQTEPGIQAAIEAAKAPAATQGLFDALQKADPGSMQANALTAQILKQGGLKMVFGGERPGSPVWRINPQNFLPEMVASSPVYANKGQVDSSGNQYGGYNFAPIPPTSLNPTGTPAQFQPTAMTGIGPLTVKSLDTQGELEQKGRQANIDAGGGAQQQQAQLSVMKQSAANFYQGPWADSVQNAASILRVLPGINSQQLDEAVASRSTFDKNAGAFLRQAVHDTSPRAAVQEFKLIGANLPNADMSPMGLQRVLDEYMGFNDYRIAKAQAQSQWEQRPGARTPSGDVTGFETNWQDVVSPYAFMVARMSDADRSKLFQQVGQTAEGRAEIAHLNDQWQYIAAHNLNKNLQ